MKQLDDKIKERLDEYDFQNYVNVDTGEVHNDVLIVTKEDKESEIKEGMLRQQKHDYLQKKTEYTDLIKDLGEGKGFYFSHYKNLLDQIGDDYALAFRFLYLCTYAGYDRVLKYCGKFMVESDFGDVFDLSKPTVLSIKKSLFENGLVEKHENVLMVNENYFLRSSLKKEYVGNSCRVFNRGIRNIYENSKAGEHKKLGRVILLLELVHNEYNVICRNPDCSLEEDIDPLSLKEIGELIGFDTDDKHCYRLIKFLLNIEVDDRYLLEVMTRDRDQKKMLVINPKIFYKGTHMEELGFLNAFFNMGLNIKKNQGSKKNGTKK